MGISAMSSNVAEVGKENVGKAIETLPQSGAKGEVQSRGNYGPPLDGYSEALYNHYECQYYQI